MKKYTFHAAQIIYSGQEQMEAEIAIIAPEKLEPFPEDDLRELRVAFYAEASLLEHVLFNNLPGGTYDQLLAKMMKRKASLFIVPLGEPEAV